MADIRANCPAPSGEFKEAVCIDAGRVFDSCCDRDCLEDLRVYFSCANQEIVSSAQSVRVRSAEVINVLIDVEPVSFNRGFYSCDLTFFFLIELDVFTAPHTMPTCIKGVSFYQKKVILYGSEGNVRSFSNDYTVEDEMDPQIRSNGNAPRCTVQCVDPIALSAKLCEVKPCFENIRSVPSCICDCLGGSIETGLSGGKPTVYVTLGLFTIVQLIRNVQMLVPVYDFCIPEKQCNDSTSEPCDIFRNISFPIDEFFPPRPCNIDDCGCGCNNE